MNSDMLKLICDAVAGKSASMSAIAAADVVLQLADAPKVRRGAPHRLLTILDVTTQAGYHGRGRDQQENNVL
jgi:hypothetical protein